jgi:hypothetical protein
VLRGSIQANKECDDFLMARLDSRVKRYDCILEKQPGYDWKECNDIQELSQRGQVSPSQTWLRMRVVANDNIVELYRNNDRVDWISDAKIVASKIALFAEIGNAYVRKVVISQRDRK